MCEFLSGIAFKNGDVTCLPEATHSHEDLIRYLKLKDKNERLRGWCRVEFTPEESSDLANVDKYVLRVDDRVPEWWADAKESVERHMRRIVSQIIIAEDRDIVLGGFWIIGDGIKVECIKNARVHVMLDSSQVGKMWGSSQVGEMWDSSQVGEMWGSSQVGKMLGSSQVGEMWDSSQVRTKGKAVIIGQDNRTAPVETK